MKGSVLLPKSVAQGWMEAGSDRCFSAGLLRTRENVQHKPALPGRRSNIDDSMDASHSLTLQRCLLLRTEY